jgi:hypothetical protein
MNSPGLTVTYRFSEYLQAAIGGVGYDIGTASGRNPKIVGRVAFRSLRGSHPLVPLPSTARQVPVRVAHRADYDHQTCVAARRKPRSKRHGQRGSGASSFRPRHFARFALLSRRRFHQVRHDLLTLGRRIGKLGPRRQLDVGRDPGDGASQRLVELRVGHQSLILFRLLCGAGACGDAGARANAGAHAEGDEDAGDQEDDRNEKRLCQRSFSSPIRASYSRFTQPR